VIHVITWITRVATINYISADQGEAWLLVTGLGPWARAKPAAYRLYSPSKNLVFFKKPNPLGFKKRCC